MDRWCPNCRQMVKPKEDHQATAGCVGAIVIGLALFAILKITGVEGDWVNIIWLPAAAIALNFFKDKGIRTTRSCPICRSEALHQSEQGEGGASEKKCPGCGTPNSLAAQFCGGCGASLAAEQAPPAKPVAPVCVACGAENAPANRFCASCGQPLGQAVGTGGG